MMLKYKLLWEQVNEIAYEYFPEGKQHSGIIIFNKVDKSFNLKKRADNDDYSTYAGMMYSKIRDFAKSNEFRNNGIVAWC